MSFSKSLYKRLPYFVQKVAFDYVSKKEFQKRFGPEFYRHFEALNKSWYFTEVQIRQLQTEKLKGLLAEAFHFSPYYEQIFKERGITAADISNDPFAVLKQLPFLEKSHIRNHLDELVSTNPDLKGDGVNYTSGSTGTPMKTIISDDSIHQNFALWKRFHHLIGLPLHPRSVRFSGNQIIPLSQKTKPFWHYSRYEKRLFMSIYHLSPANMPVYIDKLKAYKPELLDGYPSAIYTLANYIINNHVALGFRPTAICTTAEPLTQHIRERIEQGFGCRVYNQYSASEGVVYITECTHGNLHVNLDSGVVEYITEQGREGQGGEVCQLVISGFRNLKTPLIRYRTGDWVRLPAESVVCGCGSHMPVISEIFGRVEDYLIDEHGIEQGMVSYRTFKMAKNILKAQIIQDGPGMVTLNIVRDKQYTGADERFVTGKLKEILGNSISITIYYLDEIKAGPNGKFKTVIKAF